MFNFFKKQSTIQAPKTLGQLGEEFAQGEYKNRGYKIVAANFFNRKGIRKGEVDFIAVNNTQIIFVEVKTRNVRGTEKFGSGAESVNIYKQQKLLKAVKIFLLQNPEFQHLQPSIDVCVVRCNEFDKTPFSAILITNAVEDSS
jgi:uncharacterized protein (TIGR00252 family)